MQAAATKTPAQGLQRPIHENENYVTRLAVSANDRRAVYALRYQIYVEEMRLLQLFGNCRGEISDYWDDHADLIATFTERGELVGTSRMNYGRCDADLPYPSMMKYEHFKIEEGELYCYTSRTMVDAAYRKGGFVFNSMMKEYLLRLQAKNVRFAFLYCQPHLVHSFSQMGFRVYQSPVSHEEIGDVVPMVMDIKDLEYLRETRALSYRYLARGRRNLATLVN